jgi:hypothetical protein
MDLIAIPLTILGSKYLIKQWSSPRLMAPDPTIPYDDLLNYAKLSRRAYDPPEQWPEATFISVHHTQLYTWIENDIRYIIFRGTEDMGDLKDDIDVRMSVFDDNVRVHRGFYRQFEAIISRLETEIGPDCQTIIFSGHSLGAGLASLGAFHFSFALPQAVIKCYTFGSPRVGNHAFVEKFQERIPHHSRLYNFDDPVPMLPSTGNYQHIDHGTLCLGEHGTYDFYNRDYYWLWRPIIETACADWWRPIGPHHIDEYIDRLQGAQTVNSS